MRAALGPPTPGSEGEWCYANPSPVWLCLFEDDRVVGVRGSFLMQGDAVVAGTGLSKDEVFDAFSKVNPRITERTLYPQAIMFDREDQTISADEA